MSALISECGTYRYTLTRRLADYGLRIHFPGGSVHPHAMPGPAFIFIGVNPSTADAVRDDATVRKWIGFTERWGGVGFVAGNVFAARTTDVRRLASMADPVGPDNDKHLSSLFARADIVIPCWGNTGKVPPSLRGRFDQVRELLRKTTTPIKVFGLTKSGDPAHPLMLGYDTQLQEWKP